VSFFLWYGTVLLGSAVQSCWEYVHVESRAYFEVRSTIWSWAGSSNPAHHNTVVSQGRGSARPRKGRLWLEGVGRVVAIIAEAPKLVVEGKLVSGLQGERVVVGDAHAQAVAGHVGEEGGDHDVLLAQSLADQVVHVPHRHLLDYFVGDKRISLHARNEEFSFLDATQNGLAIRCAQLAVRMHRNERNY
jgi:hypothetical protein